jgi:tRNA U38,U39,U40 pseudouridine synthase TruA
MIHSFEVEHVNRATTNLLGRNDFSQFITYEELRWSIHMINESNWSSHYDFIKMFQRL